MHHLDKFWCGLRTCCLIFLMTTPPIEGFAQQMVLHVSGRVLDRERQLPIAQVEVRLLKTYVITETDGSGNFFLILRLGKQRTLEFRRWGYLSHQLELPAAPTVDTLKITVELIPVPLRLYEVEVVGERVRAAEPLPTSRSAIGIVRRPGAFEDPLRSLQQLPGVTLRNDWDGQISLRGATPDQTLIVIDGFVLPNPYRLQFALGGGMSLVNTGMLSRVSLSKGGFSPRFGDRVAGLIVFEAKSPQKEKSGELRLTVFDASNTLSLPFAKGRAGVLLSARRNYHDALTKLASFDNFAVPRWQDVQLKTTYQLSTRHQMDALLIGSKEWLQLKLGENSKDKINEQAETAFAGLVHRWFAASQTLWENYFSTLQNPSALSYAFHNDTTLADYRFDDRSWHWRSELSWRNHNNATWLVGIEMSWQRQWADLNFYPHNVDSPLVLPENFRGRRWRRLVAAYGEHRLNLNDVSTLSVGLRLAGQNRNENMNAEPRVTLSSKSGGAHLRLHWGLYYQTLDWQSLFRREWPMDISAWQTLPNERAMLWSGDFSVKLGKQFELGAGVYWRHLNPLLVPIDESEGTVLEFRQNVSGAEQISNLMANRPRVTRGRQAGIELVLSKAARQWHLNLRYTYSRSLMRDLDDRQWIAAATDRPHDWALDFSHRLFGVIELSSVFRYSSGNPYSPVIALNRDLNHRRWPSGNRLIYGERNSWRHPEYLRFDLRGTYEFIALRANWQIYVEWLNTTNHQNLYQYLWTAEDDTDKNYSIVRQPITMMPQLVVGGIAVRF
ncbi:TonB-dependent receptor [candidate division KSB1 bacterium]|nr:TonB-dependent receptor [candidate division KSB1 bacterium]